MSISTPKYYWDGNLCLKPTLKCLSFNVPNKKWFFSFMKEKILITSALPYANGPLHFGHIAGAYLPGDCYARFQRLQGNDVLYLCGSDEHGVAITLSAELAGRTPKEHV